MSNFQSPFLTFDYFILRWVELTNKKEKTCVFGCLQTLRICKGSSNHRHSMEMILGWSLEVAYETRNDGHLLLEPNDAK